MNTVDSVFLIITAVSISLFFIILIALAIYSWFILRRLVRAASLTLNTVEAATKLIKDVNKVSISTALFKLVKSVVKLNNNKP